MSLADGVTAMIRRSRPSACELQDLGALETGDEEPGAVSTTMTRSKMPGPVRRYLRT